MVIGGRGADETIGVGEETGMDGTGAWLRIGGDWYMCCGEDIRYGLAGVGDVGDMGDMGEAAIPYAGSPIKLGINIKCGLASNGSAP